jgi:hypothetical protein
VERARRVFRELRIPYREIDIEADEEAAAKVKGWTGFYSVPTIVIAEGEGLDPALPILPLPEGASPRGVDRGGMITEPRADQLVSFLRHHGFL